MPAKKSDAVRRAAPYVISSDCMNCGVCEFMCPTAAIVPAPQHFVIGADRCDGCGICVPYCVVSAIVKRVDLVGRQERTVKAGLKRVLNSL